MVSTVEYDKFRHITLEDAKRISGIKPSDLEKSISSIGSTIYGDNGTSFIDRLDLGRAVYLAKNGTNGHEKQRGIDFERYFTDGKTDPFETAGPYRKEKIDIEDDSGNVIFSKECEFPESWGAKSKSVAASKYFFKPSKPEWQAKIEGGGEYTPKQLFGRISRFFRNWGEKLGYFKTKESAQAFEEELQFLQINQMATFNSPVNFNAGIYDMYGIEGSPALNYVRDPKTGEISKVNGCYIRPQGHACFIIRVEDNLESILEHYKTEGAIFSLGSGVGLDIGTLRGKDEPLSSGGKSSGSISFLEGFDNLAGRIKSGGKTRRAARMTTMRQDHPDAREFIRTKVRADKKALDLIKAGYQGGFEGEAYTTVALQNTNLSVRLDNFFFEQIEKGGSIPIRWVKNGEVKEQISADQLLKEISFGSWRIGDPAVQYESKIQEMNTCPKSGRINSTNPCSEYVFLDDTSCNLASLNLLKFSDQKGNFNRVEAFSKACNTIAIAQDILNDAGSYPNEKIAKTSPEFRTIGLGYANLGALLMRKGLPYDSEESRAFAATITAIMQGEAIKTSAKLAEGLEPFVHYELNRLDMLNVLRKQQSSLGEIKWDLVKDDTLKEITYKLWQEGLQLTEINGARNAQSTVIAPTGTIGRLMDCDTTGAEPGIALVSKKKMAGGAVETDTVNEVPNALKNLSYTPKQITDITKFMIKEKKVEGAPHLSADHYAVFDTANTVSNGRAIGFEGHIRMLGAIQPFISGAISKTNNLPERATVKEIYDGYVLGNKLGLKAVSVFRQNSKPVSVLSVDDDNENGRELKWGEKKQVPQSCDGHKTKVTIGDTKLHIWTSEYPDGTVSELFASCHKSGSTMKGLVESFGVGVSTALQRGAPLEEIIGKYVGHEFEPKGMTDHEYIKLTKSPLDFIARWLAVEYLGKTEYANSDVDKSKLRGARNGAFEAYAKKIDEWNFEEVIKDPKLGGFVTESQKEDKNEKPLAVVKKQNGNGKKLGIPCKKCGNLLRQTAPNCYECDNCFEKEGGCG